MDRNYKKIVLTGGHAVTTALAVSEELVKRGSEKRKWSIYWVGPAYAMEGKRIPTLASIVIPGTSLKFRPIIAGRFQRKFTFWSIVALLKFPLGFIHALLILSSIRPDIILSFGGYASFPVVVVGWFFRVPIVLHDQTNSFNRTNKLSSFFAKKIALARGESMKYFPKKKVVVTGNPILPQIAKLRVKEKIGSPVTLYVTGGSTGSRSINALLEEILPALLKKYRVIHQVGFLEYEKFLKLKSSLNKNLSQNYQPYSFVDPLEVHKIYKEADIIVSRAGANTISEIIAVKRPSIVIPLVIGRWNEQLKNAEVASDTGLAIVLDQDRTQADVLLKKISYLEKNWNSSVKKVKERISPDIEASKKVVDIIESLLN